MTKTALLENSTAGDVVRSSAKVPAPRPQREYADFDAFVENADKLMGFFKAICKRIEQLSEIEFEWLEWDPERRILELQEERHKLRRAKMHVENANDVLATFPRARKRLAEFNRDQNWYGRKELYDIKGKGKSERWTLSRRVVAEQIGLLLASFQNSRPGTPKVFGKMMVEEVYAKRTDACVLESACRRVRREHDFPPSISELLKAIEKETSAWSDRFELNDHDVDVWRPDLEQAIAEAQSTIAKAEAKLPEFEAIEAKRKAKREAYERIPHEERRAYDNGQRLRSDAWRDNDRSMSLSEYGRDGRERELAAFVAGLNGEPIPGLCVKTNGAGRA